MTIISKETHGIVSLFAEDHKAVITFVNEPSYVAWCDDNMALLLKSKTKLTIDHDFRPVITILQN